MTVNRKSPTFCIYPSTMLGVKSDGHFRICCYSTSDLTIDGKVCNEKDNSLDDIWNKSSRVEIEEALSNGIRHENCRRCWIEEDSGVESRRTNSINRFNDIDIDSLSGPIELELKLDITCNIKCRTCSPWHSTYWMQEYYDINNENKSLSIDQYYLKTGNSDFDLTEKNSNKNSNKTWEGIMQCLPTVKHITIFGGETFIMKSTWAVLDYSVENGFNKDQSLKLSTNCTVYPTKNIATLAKFKNIFLDLSLDGVGARAEYLRFPSKWSVIDDTVKKFHALTQSNPNFELTDCYTFSIFNAYYFDEMFEYISQFNILVSINNLVFPNEQDPRNLYSDIKKKIIEKLKKYVPHESRSKQWEFRLAEIELYLLSDIHVVNEKEMFKKFWKTTTDHDKYRNESFETTFPEFYSLLQSNDVYKEIMIPASNTIYPVITLIPTQEAKPDTGCINADAMLELTSEGKFRLCCQSTQFLSIDGVACTVNTTSIQDVWTKSSRVEMVNALNSGVRHKNCDSCWNLEDAGIESRRIRDGRWAATRKSEKTLHITDVFDIRSLRFLDVKLSIICNLKCRTCSPHCSTKWLPEFFGIRKKEGESLTQFKIRYNVPDVAVVDNESVWKQLDDILPNLLRIEAFGGEPMLIESFWKLLKIAIDRNFSKDIIVLFNSNCTIFSDEKNLILDKFQDYGINLSIDDIGDRFEYMRHPAKWLEVMDVMNKLYDRQRHGRQVSITLTVSTFNVFYLDEIYNFFSKYKIYINLNLIRYPQQFCPRFLPRSVRQDILSKLEARVIIEETPTTWNESLAVIRHYLLDHIDDRLEEESVLFRKGWNEIKVHDRYRNESFEKTFPEFYIVLRRHSICADIIDSEHQLVEYKHSV